MSESDLGAFIEPVARLLLGEPNPHLSTAKELRWGTRGSMVVNLEKGVFFNNEAGEGGGTLKLIEAVALVPHREALTWLHDHFPESKTNGHAPVAQITAAYPYEDLDRTLLYQVCRKHPKTFVQRRPDGHGDWIWSTKGVRQVPYRLPELREAIAAGRLVWIVEGEKDADNLRSVGLAATTNSGGANKWKPELNPYFQGVDAVVAADNDEPGREHAQAVAKALEGVARRVRVLDLGAVWRECPAKGDVSDYLATHSAAELEALAERLDRLPAPAPIGALFTGDQLEGVPVPKRLWHVRDLVPARTVTLLGGDGGVGKSTLALQLAIATAADMTWIGSEVRGGRVLYMSAEDDRDELHRRCDQIALFYGIALERLAGLILWTLAEEDAVLVNGPPGQPIACTERWGELQAIVRREKPVLVVLDSLADVYGANENDRSQVRSFVRLLRGLVAPCDAALVLLAHPSLAGLSSGSGLSGSTAWNNSVRSRLYLSTPEVEEGAEGPADMRSLSVKKANYAQAGGEMQLRWSMGAFMCDAAVNMSSALDRQIAADRADRLFLELLDAWTAQHRNVSHRPGPSYAPVEFSRAPGAKTASKAFEAAMQRLFHKRQISVEEIGPASRRIARIIRVQAPIVEDD